VIVPGIGAGTIIKVRHDSFGRAIYTVDLDDKQATPTGIYWGREEELKVETR
jgi:hypothetical protein